jgi:beta-phosphoglucomutase-like phosphatase (HAD superfamily)
MLKGAIFDFNGTLFLDANKQEKAWQRFAQQQFGKVISDTEFVEHFHGRNNQYSLEYLAGRGLTATELAQLIDRKESFYRDLCKADLVDFHLTPGTGRFLDELKKLGYKMTIATASGWDNLDSYFQSFNLT